MVLCCGEDPVEFRAAAKAVFGTMRLLHAYRCYAFLRRGPVSLVWTGIGTGCVEPLLCEILDEPQIERMILVGTAGAVSRRAKLGMASQVREARIACAGISPKREKLLPNWDVTKGATIVSTDNYYGFTLKQAWPTPVLWANDKRLARDVPKFLKWADLVDMETGQFYHLCRALRPELKFVSIKGAANPLSDFAQQPLHSESVLHDALRQAKDLLTRRS